MNMLTANQTILKIGEATPDARVSILIAGEPFDLGTIGELAMAPDPCDVIVETGDKPATVRELTENLMAYDGEGRVQIFWRVAEDHAVYFELGAVTSNADGVWLIAGDFVADCG